MRNAAAVFAILVFGAACAAPDPVLIEEPEPAAAMVAEVQEMPGGMEEVDPGMEGDGHAEEATDHMDDATDHMDDAADHMDEATEHMDEASGGHGETETIPEAIGDPVVELDVVLREFAIKPGVLQIPAGETVRFHIYNEGAERHEFRLSNQHRVDEHIEAGHEEGHGDEEGHHGNADLVLFVEPGERRSVDITFPEGDTETYDLIVCMLPGHYEGGMKLELDYES